MKLQKKDFIEIDFTGKTTEGEIFDSNIKENLEKLNSKIPPKPFVFALGEDMFLKGIDEFLIGKDLGKYKIELTPEKAFGKRDPKLIQLIPERVFRENKLNPIQGATFNFDNRIAKILSVSGGRIRVDFNNPLAGRDVIYDIEVKKKVQDINEKTKALIDFFFRQDLKFEIKEKQLTIESKKEMKQFIEMFKDKFKELLDLELEVKDE
ncbi:peptidylprolyl isomerase [Nanoarchaeota archaeon]